VTRADLWPAVEPLLSRVERPARYVDREWGARHDVDAAYRAVLVYPDTYEIGQANQALAILYGVLNSIPGVAAERAYLPWADMSALMREHSVPLFSLESCAPVRGFDLIGITIPYELTYSNILETLDLAGVALRSADRVEGDPIVLGGGPSVYNAEPVAPFFDAILIGEGEEAVGEIVAAHRAAVEAGLSRAQTLRSLADVPGVYVPSLYEVRHGADGEFAGVTVLDGAPATVVKRVVADFESAPVPTCGIVVARAGAGSARRGWSTGRSESARRTAS